MDKSLKRATLYGHRAIRSSKGSEKQKKYAKLALAEIDSVGKLLDPDEDEESHKKIVHWKAGLMSMTDQPEESIAVTKEALVLSERYPGTFNGVEIGELKGWQAEAYSNCGKWDEAVTSYKSLIREQKQLGGNPSSVILMDYCRAMYELGKYDEAIEMGKFAIELNRSRPGVHKYVALSQKAMGGIDEAKKNMSRAILYEEHWDMDNLQKNKQLLRELNNL